MFDWVTGFLEQGGYVVVALLMFLENVFPPIPSELIMPLAGFNAAQGEQNIVLVIVAGSIGSLAGALLWYYIGLWIGLERLKRFSRRHGRWLTLTPDEIDQADAWFDAYGGWAVLVGRLIPTVRTFISVPAGMSGMRLGKFLIFTASRNDRLDELPDAGRLLAGGVVRPRLRLDQSDLRCGRRPDRAGLSLPRDHVPSEGSEGTVME